MPLKIQEKRSVHLTMTNLYYRDRGKMMTTVKDILCESLSRSNLVPRKRSAPADMLESAFRLFKGILQRYNFANFISFARNEIEVIPTDEVIELEIDDMNSISNVMEKHGDEWIELRYVSFDQFYTENTDYIYSWKYTAHGTIQLYLGKNVKDKIKVIFNKNLNYELDEELHVPEIYIELFTAALTYKLAVTFPRTDPAQVTLLKAELDDIEKTVNSMISSNKIITRSVTGISNMAAFKSGSFIM